MEKLDPFKCTAKARLVKFGMLPPDVTKFVAIKK